MKIGIIGTRGIPNNYGGFEQFAEYLSKGLVERGHDVSVYSSHNHLYQEAHWNNVRLIHILNPERWIGTVGQFIYDFLAILDSRKRNFDIILQLGYTSSSVWGWLLPKRSIIVSNMDGLEWKRSKFSKTVQRFLMLAERLAVKTSDFLIADSKGIQKYLMDKYKTDSKYIAYGTHVFNDPQPSLIEQYGVSPFAYSMLIARIEPENNIEMILDGVHLSSTNRTFLVIGNFKINNFGKRLVAKYRLDERIRFLGPIYDINILNNLRYYSHLYFHGHSVGGTNPSLLEAMASNSLICAHRNEFNSSILEDDAFFFCSKNDVKQIVESMNGKEEFRKFLSSNIDKVKSLYLWDKIINDCEDFFTEILSDKSNRD